MYVLNKNLNKNLSNDSEAVAERIVLSECLPEVLRQIREIMRICEIEQSVCDRLAEDMEQALWEQYVSRAGVCGIERWEKLLGIVPPKDAAVGERRRVVQLRLSEQLPFTLLRLREMLSGVVSEDEYILELIPEEYLLRVRLALSGKGSLNEIKEVLRRVVPANILLDMMLLYNTHGIVGGKTHGELAALSHREIREEVFE